MHMRKMICGALAAFSLCIASALSTAIAIEPVSPGIEAMQVSAPSLPAVDALALQKFTISTRFAASPGPVADVNRIKRTWSPTLPASPLSDRRPALTRAIEILPAASLRPRPGWRWSI